MTQLAQSNQDGTRVEYHQLTSANPASINDGAQGTIVFTLTGLSTSDYLAAEPLYTTDLLELTREKCVITANTITQTVSNNTGGAVDAGAQTANFIILKKS